MPISGKVPREDYNYERNGVRNIFMAVEPKGGKRLAEVTRYRKKKEFALFTRRLVDERYSEAEKLHIVLDNLNTHNESSFYEAFDEQEAKRISDKVQFHYTPKHASWLNMAEIEIGVMDRQAIKGRIGDEATLKRRVAIWQGQRNYDRTGIRWTFTKEKAEQKLGKYYI